ncbi:hypothetical protein M0802_006332 [Mischocyttarus mexicanus]|nr:hypothetical protein M0802_006332 [Mischocyttarus mexicanus]
MLPRTRRLTTLALALTSDDLLHGTHYSQALLRLHGAFCYGTRDRVGFSSTPGKTSGILIFIYLFAETTEEDDKVQGLVSSSTEIYSVEVLSSKAKREQVLRNILAARRRRMSKQRNSRLIDVTQKDPPADILEAQETKHEVYSSVSLLKNGTDVDKETLRAPMEENLTTLMSERHHEDTESTITMAPVTSIPPLKSSEADNIRKKKTVSMPESLYKHFRPVESNIPMEDMSQFLYFGQKLQPELQNVTTIVNDFNELVSVTPPTLRRRNPSKRTSLSSSTTTPTTTPTTTTTMTTTTTTSQPEEISKEETNVALERRIIEKNKVSKTTKSTLRDLPNSYYRKARLSDSTIATNVIPSKEMTQNDNTTKLDEQVEERRGDKDNVQKTKVSRGSFRRSKKVEDIEEKPEIDNGSEYRSKDDKKSRENNSIDESTVRSTTLRIVVMEPEPSSVKDSSTTTTTTTTATTTTTTTTTTPLTTPRNITQETRRHQQQHVYAYTITNVTRLLRNYTGPGLSEETGVRGRGRADEVGGTGGGGSSRRSNASSEITNSRVKSPSSTTEEASAGAAGISKEEPSQSGGLSTGRSVEAVGRPSTIATPTLVGERRRKVLASGAHHRAAGAQSAPQRAPVRIASALTRNRQHYQQHLSDHHRVALVINEGTTTDHHHHQQQQQQQHHRSYLRKSASAVLHRGAVNPTDASPEAMPSTGTRDSLLLDADKRNTLDLERREDESRPVNETSLKVNQTFEDILTTNESLLALNVPEETTIVDLIPSSLSTELSTENISNSDTKDQVPKENNYEHSTTTTMMTEVTTTSAPPAFPVTPKLLVETTSSNNRITTNETPTSTSTESLNQLTPSRKPDQDRPFGLAADLDPSEIQKMYRSQNTSSTESNTLPNLETSTVSTTSQLPIQIGHKQLHDLYENRGRSLSDKTKQEDDVLPIMQLYNTSDIFDDSSTLGPPTRTIELPLEESNATKDREESPQEAPGSRYTTPSVTNKPTVKPTPKSSPKTTPRTTPKSTNTSSTFVNRTRYKSSYPNRSIITDYSDLGYQPIEFNRTFFDSGSIAVSPRESVNISEVTKRHDGDAVASQETVAVVSYILATLVVFPIAVGVGLILRRLIIRNRKVLEESDTSSEISYRKDALNLENGDFKTSIEKAITKLPRIQHLCHEAEKPPPPSSQESRWEFPRDKLRLQTVLGQGNFGQVWKAEADDLTGHQGTTRLVAVKTVKEGASEREKEDLVRELEIMQQLGSHPNVVTLLGCCTEEERAPGQQGGSVAENLRLCGFVSSAFILSVLDAREDEKKEDDVGNGDEDGDGNEDEEELERRATLPDTRIRNVRKAVGLSTGSPHQAGLLQFQRGLGGPDIERSDGIRILRSTRHGISCVKKGKLTLSVSPYPNKTND